MIRIIVTTVDAGRSANVGGPVVTEIKSFDLSAPALEAFVVAMRHDKYIDRFVSHVEFLPEQPSP